MKFENNNIYISNSELLELDNALNLINSTDTEVYRLGIECIVNMLPKDGKLLFTKYNRKIKGISFNQDLIFIDRNNWIII